MVLLWENHYLLLLVTFIWLKWKMMVWIPSKPIFYRRVVDEIYSRRKLGDNVLFNKLNSYHRNIKLTIKINPSKSLDNKLTNINGTYKLKVCPENRKLPSAWNSAISKHSKWNTVDGDVHHSKRISSNFHKEIPTIEESLWSLITHCVSTTICLMNLKRVKNVPVKVLWFQLVRLKLQNL